MLLILFACWMAASRFGAPLPAPPALEPGKTGLIANTAALLVFGGHFNHVIRRYHSFIRREVAEGLHAPAHLGGEDLDNWLRQVEQHRGVRPGADDIAQEIDKAHMGRNEAGLIIRLAAKTHRWKKEMLDGTRPDQ